MSTAQKETIEQAYNRVLDHFIIIKKIHDYKHRVTWDAHKDKTKHHGELELEGDTILFHSYAEDDHKKEQILQSVGLELKDLYPKGTSKVAASYVPKPKKSNKTSNKYQVRVLTKAHDFRYFARSAKDYENASFIKDDHRSKIANSICKDYSRDTYEDAKCRYYTGVVDGKHIEGIIFPEYNERRNLVYNPNQKDTLIYLEGRTDYLTAIELGLHSQFGLVSRFNKQDLNLEDGYNHVFILDYDQSHQDLQKVKKEAVPKGKRNKLVTRYCRPPKGFNDFSDWIFSKDKPSYSDVLSTIENADLVYNNLYIPFPNSGIKEPKGVVKLNGIKIAYEQGITVLTGQTGCGKSHACEAIIRYVLDPKQDTFGLETTAKRILYIDTEQPVPIFEDRLKKIFNRCGVDFNEYISNWRSPSELTEETKFVALNTQAIIDFKEVQETFRKVIADYEPDLVILDNLSDLIADDNNKELSNLLLKEVVPTSNRDYSLIAVVHQNPGQSTKPKGHLGSEALRKSSASFMVKKLEDGTRCITTKYQHGKVRADYDQVESYFEFDGGFPVSCEPPENIRKDKIEYRLKEVLPDLISVSRLSYADLCNRISKEFSISNSNAKKYISNGLKHNLLLKDIDGRNTFYRLNGNEFQE